MNRLRILANENIPLTTVEALRRQRHDVEWIRIEAPGLNDDAVLARARESDRLLLTQDKDFADLVFAKGVSASAGVVLLRLDPLGAAGLARATCTALESEIEWMGWFHVVEPDRIRGVPIPELPPPA